MAHSISRAGGKELRRYARRSTLQTANIRFGDGTAIPSEIRDYCQTGLYVSFLGEGTPDAAIPALVGTPVRVEFGGQPGRFKCSGSVAHVSPGGVGVFVAAMPAGALLALRTAGGPLTRTDPGRAGSALDNQQAQALQTECTNLFRTFLGAVIQDFFQRSIERLSEADQDELSFLERSRFEYGAQELAHRRSQIEDDFFNAIRDRIQNVGSAADLTSEPPTKSKLALVDEGEFEDWLNLSAVIKQVEGHIVTELDVFEPRYSRLVGQFINRKNNPFGPEMIGRTFQGAIQTLDFSNSMRTVLYKSLGQALLSRIQDLYTHFNQTLEPLQPLVPAKPVKETERSKPAPELVEPAGEQAADDDKPQSDPADIADTLNALYKESQSGADPAVENAEYSLDRILAALNKAPRSGAAGSGVLGGKITRPAGGAADTQQPDVLNVVERLHQVSRQLLERDEPASPPSGGAGHGKSAQAEAGLRELLIALDGLPLVNRTAPGSSTLPPLSDQIDARIASTSGKSRRLALDHRRILDATSNLLARAHEDFVPSSDVEFLVKRLERPLLKLALQDRDFPSQSGHPARQVLNLIEQYAVAADDKGKFFDAKLQRFLYLLVDRVCSRADDDPGVFDLVRDSLERVLLPILQIRRTRIARLQEASEGQEGIRSARSRANMALEERLAGREVPGMLLRLLDAGWRQYLVLLEMRQGAQGEAWEAALGMLDQLLVWLNPARTDAAPSQAGKLALLVEVERILKTVNVDANLVAAFMDELGARLTNGEIALPAGNEMVLVPPGKLARLNEAAGDVANSHRQLVDRLRVGDWWDFVVDGSRVPMQIIWLSQPPFSCAFTNRSATRKQVLSLAELARKIRDEQIKPGKDLDLPLIERSENALFDETYQDLMHQVMHDPLTGLLNRKGFMQHLSQMPVPDGEDKAHAVGIIEFDQFRLVYNTCGMEAAENLARSLVNEVRAQIGPDAVLASFRDDTLAILLPNCSRTEGCPTVEKLLEQVKDYHFQHEQHSYSIGFNIGLSEYAPEKFNAAQTIRHADSACITAKSLGRNRVQVYEQASPQLKSQESLMDWAGRIDSLLEGNGLHLRCQQVRPVNAEADFLPYYEILLGIEGADGVAINPTHFIPTVERLQRAHEIDIWVMRKVFAWIGDNPEAFASVGGFAINLSATSLSSPEVMSYLQGVLPNSGFPTGKITFEITETAAIGSYGAAQDFIREVRRYGCKFSLDDFGSGFTSYSHLKNLRTDSLKIDGSFVREMLQNPNDYAMVKSMNDIGHSLGLRTVAEYVESAEILEALREIGVDYAQGYAVHKPCGIDEIVADETVAG